MEIEAWENSGSHGAITKFRLIPGNLFFPSKTVKECYQDQPLPMPPPSPMPPGAKRGVLFEQLLHARTTRTARVEDEFMH